MPWYLSTLGCTITGGTFLIIGVAFIPAGITSMTVMGWFFLLAGIALLGVPARAYYLELQAREADDEALRETTRRRKAEARKAAAEKPPAEAPKDAKPSAPPSYNEATGTKK